MLRIKLLRLLYGEENCDFFIQKVNKDCLNYIGSFLCKGYTLNNETMYNIKLIQHKPYTYNMFKDTMGKLLNEYENLNDNISRLKQSELVYRFINMYYSKVASTDSNKLTNVCYIKAKRLQIECNSLYLDENKKILHTYNTRKNFKMKEDLHKLNASIDKFKREIETAIHLLIDITKKYSTLPPSIWN